MFPRPSKGQKPSNQWNLHYARKGCVQWAHIGCARNAIAQHIFLKWRVHKRSSPDMSMSVKIIFCMEVEHHNAKGRVCSVCQTRTLLFQATHLKNTSPFSFDRFETFRGLPYRPDGESVVVNRWVFQQTFVQSWFSCCIHLKNSRYISKVEAVGSWSQELVFQLDGHRSRDPDPAAVFWCHPLTGHQWTIILWELIISKTLLLTAQWGRSFTWVRLEGMCRACVQSDWCEDGKRKHLLHELM